MLVLQLTDIRLSEPQPRLFHTMNTKTFLITLLATIISAKPRRSHDSVRTSDTRPSTTEPMINYDAYARMYAKIRAKTRLIARKIQREKLYALKDRRINNFGAMDLDESRRHRKSQEIKLKKRKSVVVKAKKNDGADKFRKERNTYRLKQRKDIYYRYYNGSKSHGTRRV